MLNYLARPTYLWHPEKCAIVTFFILISPIEDQLSHNVLDRSSPNFQDRYTYG